MSSLYSKCSSVQPTATHRFLKKLSDKNKLLRCYTQNIDGLEGRAGLSYAFDYTQPTSSTPKPKSKKPSVSSSAKVVQLHGTLDAVRCGCGWNGSWTGEMVECMQSGQGPQCPDCKSFGKLSHALIPHRLTQCAAAADKRKSRGARTVRQVGHYGQLKPNGKQIILIRPTMIELTNTCAVLLYDDNHPAGTTETILDYSDVDVTKPVDLVLVMGTSLKVRCML